MAWNILPSCELGKVVINKRNQNALTLFSFPSQIPHFSSGKRQVDGFSKVSFTASLDFIYTVQQSPHSDL